MKIFLFGKNGQVGRELNRSLQSLGEVVAFGREEADFSNPDSLRKIVSDISPDLIVNAVAYTAVDKAEKEEELASIVNGIGPGVLTEEALKINALLVHYSTDYVFDGTKEASYVETDKPNPINAYGRTKLAGEVAIQSPGLRLFDFSNILGICIKRSKLLVDYSKARTRKRRIKYRCRSDWFANPPVRLIAETTSLCINHATREKQDGVFSSDLYHLTTSGYASWHGFAEEIVYVGNQKLSLQFKIKEVKTISSKEYPTPDKRSISSKLCLDKLSNTFDIIMPDWVKSLNLCNNEINII